LLNSKKCLICGKDFYPRKDKFDIAKTCSRKCCCMYAGRKSREKQLTEWNKDTYEQFIIKMKKSFETFFEKNDACWVWNGAKRGQYRLPYGSFTFRGKEYSAHRASYMIYKDKIPKGKLVLHMCDNASCVNPDHLYSGIYIDNQLDKLKRGRCKVEKLTIEQVKEIKEKLATGITSTKLSKDYGVSMTTMHSIKTGKTWKHVKL